MTAATETRRMCRFFRFLIEAGETPDSDEIHAAYFVRQFKALEAGDRGPDICDAALVAYSRLS